MFPAEVFRGTMEKFVAILSRHQIRFHLTGGITIARQAEELQLQPLLSEVLAESDEVG